MADKLIVGSWNTLEHSFLFQLIVGVNGYYMFEGFRKNRIENQGTPICRYNSLGTG